MATSEYQVTGMTCGHCEMSIREEVSQIPGVDEIQVSAQTGKLVVSSTSALDDAAVLDRRGDGNGRRGGRGAGRRYPLDEPLGERALQL